MSEEKRYWIVCFPKHETYKTLYNTEEGARKWVELRYPNEEYFLVEYQRKLNNPLENAFSKGNFLRLLSARAEPFFVNISHFVKISHKKIF